LYDFISATGSTVSLFDPPCSSLGSLLDSFSIEFEIVVPKPTEVIIALTIRAITTPKAEVPPLVFASLIRA